jgi:drug/metabolite transporter (DMT)-like permease
MAVAILFVVLWSTGFIGAKLGLPYAGPFTFLLARFWLVTAMVLVLAVATRAPWPRTSREVLHLAVTGFLIHAIFLSGVFSSLYHGVSAGVTALIVGLQPVLTAVVVGPLLGEKVILRLYVLIRREKAASVASLFYLVPPCTALIAYLVFGETLDPGTIFGMGIAVVGVALVVR